MARAVKQGQGLKILVTLASLVILITGLKMAEGFFVPVLLAFFIATVSFPITHFLRTHRVPRSLAVLITVMVDFAFLIGLVIIAISLVGDLQEKWEVKYRDLSYRKVQAAEDWAVSVLDEWEVENSREEVRKYVTADLLQQLREIKVEDIVDMSTNLVGRVASFFGTAFVVLIITVFMLTEARMFGRRLNAICEARGPNIQRMLSATKDIQRFLGIKTVVSLATGFLAGFLCWAADLDFYVLWGILAYALNYIPVVGSVIAGVPPAILALLLYGWPSAIAVAVGYTAINVFLGNFVEPMMMGHRFGMSTLVVIVSVMFWGWVWGPVGMLLAVPIMMMLKVVLDNSYEYRWLAIAISKERQPTNEANEIRGAVEAADDVQLPGGTAPEGGGSSQ